MKTIILAGGLGTRLAEETTTKPKPAIEIGGYPLIWHLMSIFGAQGFKEFVVALGYKGQVLKDFFINYHSWHADLSVDLSSGKVKTTEKSKLDWLVHLIETGPHTMTGGRIKRLQKWVSDGTFMMTYGDGLSNVDLKKLVAFHKSHGKLATVTAVRPPARFGNLQIQNDRVTSFAEKAQAAEGWINGGFFVLEPKIFDYIEGDETIWERAPLMRLAEEKQLMAFHHEGFWHPIDTLREKMYAEELWNEKRAPWKIWS